MHSFLANTSFSLPALHLFPFKTANFGNLPWELKIFGKQIMFHCALITFYMSFISHLWFVCLLKKIVLEENLKIRRKAWQNWNKIIFGKKTLNIIQSCQTSSHATFKVNWKAIAA